MTNLPKIGKPATIALNKINITTLEQVAQLDEHNLAKLHGMGPKAISILKEAFSEQGLAFSQLDDDLKNVKFTVLGDLKCDNAPKRRIIRDIVIASLVGDEKYLNEWLTDDLVWKVPGSFELKGRKAFLDEINEHLQKVSSLEIKSMLTHGKEASTHGTIILNSGEEIHFAEMYEFENHKKDAKVKEITSYIIMKP
ncbi:MULTISPECIES: DNA-binding protein [Mammaliicoccus]|uniref:DNA-binding protein n=1 Tax=Mammaliicoccus TaxID=2803850 RepID=UPI001AAECB46|nr:DNA-binding protein [Mammaliicoccus sciuri]MBO3079929.1 DNA-binding protein [Mammaliicoccus sciuri]MCO4324035.1 DNA-binding protein [Mammaliicoccus sciuri]MEB5567842.1 DNA-binding protein [Mammaliicoccus sciuri]MEB6231549.1 DNA-binding protein [Mammaliicoccus sciuri]MEB7435929.1 DNA-binding protein [Mammaliicoccus sciuri]